MKKVVILAALILFVATVGYLNNRRGAPEPKGQAQRGVAIAAVTLPDTLSGNAAVGASLFEAKCAVCHGVKADGLEGAGPPLIHKIYEPSHHADESFQRAVAQGVLSHHWKFGDMAPVGGLTRGDVTMIVAYIREVQRANGIH